MITDEQLEKIRCIPITTLLEKQGYYPVEKKAAGVWFRAPWREESEPSLKVNAELNVWYDFGAHVGGDNIELIKYHHDKQFVQACELIQSLMDGIVLDTAPVPMPSNSHQKKEYATYAYLREEKIHTPSVIRYLEGRRISKAVADRYCTELHYGRTASEHLYSLAFKTGKASYELRNANFKGCIGPKCIAIIHAENDQGETDRQKACVVFEGFFNMLTYVQLLQQGSPICITACPCDMIVLNSAGFAPHAQPIFDEYEEVHCYLDNDKTGQTKTQEILDRNAHRASNEAHRYEGYNDLNDYLCGRMQFMPGDTPQEE